MNSPAPSVQKITELHERDQRSGAKAVNPKDIPVSYDAITPQWLTHFLCRGAPEAQVVDFRLGPVDNGSSNRRRIFITYNAAGQAARLPAAVFCKASHALINRFSLGLSRAAQGETMFYTQLRDRLDIDAPRAIHATYDPESFNSIIMLHDMADEVIFGAEDSKIGWPRAANMMRQMASYHAAMHEHPDLTSGRLQLRTWQQEWEQTCTLLAMESANDNGVAAAQSVIPPRLYARAKEIWPAMQRSVAAHDKLPRTLLHSDTHLKNWYLRGAEGMGLMDWQLICVGNWARDVAYAIAVALDTDDRRRWEKDLLKLYFEECQKRGAPVPSLDEAWNLYRLQLFTALAWWTITLCPSDVLPKDMQPSQTALIFIGRIARTIDDLDALSA